MSYSSLADAETQWLVSACTHGALHWVQVFLENRVDAADIDWDQVLRIMIEQKHARRIPELLELLKKYRVELRSEVITSDFYTTLYTQESVEIAERVRQAVEEHFQTSASMTQINDILAVLISKSEIETAARYLESYSGGTNGFSREQLLELLYLAARTPGSFSESSKMLATHFVANSHTTALTVEEFSELLQSTGFRAVSATLKSLLAGAFSLPASLWSERAAVRHGLRWCQSIDSYRYILENYIDWADNAVPDKEISQFVRYLFSDIMSTTVPYSEIHHYFIFDASLEIRSRLQFSELHLTSLRAKAINSSFPSDAEVFTKLIDLRNSFDLIPDISVVDALNLASLELSPKSKNRGRPL